MMVLLAVFGLAGCSGGPTSQPDKNANQDDTARDKSGKKDEAVRAQRAKLSAEDRALVDAQEWCVISTDERLGAMGAPIKIEVKGQPVFLCCSGCKERALRDPDKTLARLKELQQKAAKETRGER
jgi:hypothetical protein